MNFCWYYKVKILCISTCIPIYLAYCTYIFIVCYKKDKYLNTCTPKYIVLLTFLPQFYSKTHIFSNWRHRALVPLRTCFQLCYVSPLSCHFYSCSATPTLVSWGAKFISLEQHGRQWFKWSLFKKKTRIERELELFLGTISEKLLCTTHIQMMSLSSFIHSWGKFNLQALMETK